MLIPVVLLSLLNLSTAECQRRTSGSIPTVELTWQWLWNPESENPEEWQIFDQPSHMIMGIHNDLFICDQGACHIIRIRKDGSYVETIGREGGGPGEFRRPSYLAFNENTSTLLVTDYSSMRITLFQINESSSELIESHLSDNLGRLKVPSLILEDDHSIWTIGYELKPRIYHVAVDNSIISRFGDPWLIDGQHPLKVGLLNTGFVFDPGNGMIGYIWRSKPLVEIWTREGILNQEMPLNFPEMSMIDEYFKDNDPANLGDWVPLYFNWAYTLDSLDALFIGFAYQFEYPFTFFELNSNTLNPRRRYVCSSTPEWYGIASCVVDASTDELRFYALDRRNHGIVVLNAKSAGRN